MPPTLLYKLINNLDKMKEDSFTVNRQPAQGLRGGSFASSQSHQKSILLDNIKDQQNYLCAINTLLRMGKEAGAPEEALQQIAQSLLTARGYQSNKMLVDANQPQESLKKRRESYNWLDKGNSFTEEQALLSKLERELVQARETQSHYKCLVKYKSQKQDQIAPNTSGSPNSRKQRFKRMMKERMGVHSVESSNFYQFQAQKILQNSFKYENQCYKTISSFSHLKTMFGHAAESELQNYSQIFNAIMDRKQNFIITAGEEGLIKLWHKMSGTLVANLKGHTSFINKIQTSKSNRYLLTAGGDSLRFFDLNTLKPLGGYRALDIQEIGSFTHNGQDIFLFGDNSTLYILTQERMLAKSQELLQDTDFYQFSFGQMIGKDNSPILVFSLSPQGTHLLLGLQSGQLLMVLLSDLLIAMEVNIIGQQLTLPCILSVNAHSQQIIEAKWSSNSIMWATGAKDGRCCLWQKRNDQAVLISTLSVGNRSNKGRKKKHNYTCSYICWNCTFSHFAAGFQENVEDQDSDRGHGEVLVYSLKEHKITRELSREVSQQYGGIRAMDAHPYYPNILLICEAEGNILLFDIFLGSVINVFQQRGYHLLHPNFQLIPTECHFSQDGLSFIVATEYGSISIYGYDSKFFYTLAPNQQFFKTDFQQFTIQQGTMRAIPLTLPFSNDINEYPRGDIVNVRGLKQNNAILLNTQQLISSVNNALPANQHKPEIKLDFEFLKIVTNNIKQIEKQDQSYIKIYEQIDRLKELLIFYERERHYLTVQNNIAQKLKQLKSARHSNQGFQEEKPLKAREQQQPISRKRKLTRQSQRSRVINYADDFQYKDSEEEDYDVQDLAQQEIPEELQSFSDADDDQQQQAPRIKRRQNRNRRMTRITRQSNNYPKMYLSELDDEIPQERITRRKRKDMIQQQNQGESQHPQQQARKRVKMDEESSQNRAFSRLKKLTNEDQNQLIQEQVKECYRCQAAKASQFCYNCQYTQQYCQDCSQLRGRRVKDKFQCVICLYLKNRAEEEHEHVNEQIYRIVSKDSESYVPQINEKVRFFFQGYEEFLVQNITKLNTSVYKKNQSFRLLPHTQDSNLVKTPLCLIVSIEYLFPMKCQYLSNIKRTPGKGEKTPILMLIGLKPVQQGDVFWIFYYPGYQFLLPEHIYDQIFQKQLISKMGINDLINLQEQEVQIVQIGPIEDRFPESIWKMVKIRKTEGKRLRGNTKQIQRRVNIWRLSQEIKMVSQESDLDNKQVQRLVQQLSIWKSQPDSYFCIFQEYVQFEIYPKYRSEIPLGICLETIFERLISNYYSNRLSLEMDIQMIYQNSLKFNGPPASHEVTKKAEELVQTLINLLNNNQAPKPSNNKSFSQEKSIISNSKKEKGVKQSQQLLQSFSNQFQTRRRTRRQEQKAIRKRQQESSEYQEDQLSNDRNESFGRGVATRNTRNRNRQPLQHNEIKRVTRSSFTRN